MATMCAGTLTRKPCFFSRPAVRRRKRTNVLQNDPEGGSQTNLAKPCPPSIVCGKINIILKAVIPRRLK